MDTLQTTPQEIAIKGIAAAPGIAIGPAYLYSKNVPRVELKPITAADDDAELYRLHAAITRAEKELQKILSFAEQKLGTRDAKIFEAQIMILGDQILMKTIDNRIRKELKNAEWIVFDEIGKYKKLMLAASDEYMHERAHDVDDVTNRIIRNIQDQKLYSKLEGEAIVVSETLTPADTVIFSRNIILGYATDLGGVTSHAAIISRSLKIPAVVGLRNATKQIRTGDTIAIDGYAGLVVLNPTEETMAALRTKAARFRQFEEELVGLAELQAETPDHRKIELSANIEFPEEVESARLQGSDGVGLYRTESLLLGREVYPSEDEQFAVYSKVAEGMYPHPVIFRTFDIGGDKIAPDTYHEDNPFLGWRGSRVMLDRPELFLDQIRAILRASSRRNVRMMFPMVSKLSEIRAAKEIVARAKHDLTARGLSFDPKIKIGVMIEVPSAAILAEEISQEVDFLSIGTNDLIQYLLAVDRDNSSVAALFQQFNPAVLRTLRMIIEAGHKRHVWVGMCGEMAGDPVATVLLLGLGLDELSVNPAMLPEIKKIIRSVRYRDARRTAVKILSYSTEEEIKEFLSAMVKNKVPQIPIE